MCLHGADVCVFARSRCAWAATHNREQLRPQKPPTCRAAGSGRMEWRWYKAEYEPAAPLWLAAAAAATGASPPAEAAAMPGAPTVVVAMVGRPGGCARPAAEWCFEATAAACMITSWRSRLGRCGGCWVQAGRGRVRMLA